VVGIGDAENDQAFLSACGCAVAVDNALASVKAKVDLVVAITAMASSNSRIFSRSPIYAARGCASLNGNLSSGCTPTIVPFASVRLPPP